jgi:hypothetical protein
MDTKTEYGQDGYESTSSLFRNLTADEVEDFKTSARECYVIGSEISDLWHPVYKHECMQMNAEAKLKLVNRWALNSGG